MDCSLVRDEQDAGEIIRFRLDAAVMCAIAILSQGRCAFVTQEAMGQLMTDIAALPVVVMRIVVDDRGLTQGTVTAEKDELSGPKKAQSGATALNFTSAISKCAQMATGSIGSIGRRPMLARTRRAMRLASALNPRRNSKSPAPQLFVSTHNNVLDHLGVLLR
jgi:hypothetical protein